MNKRACDAPSNATQGERYARWPKWGFVLGSGHPQQKRQHPLAKAVLRFASEKPSGGVSGPQSFSANPGPEQNPTSQSPANTSAPGRMQNEAVSWPR